MRQAKSGRTPVLGTTVCYGFYYMLYSGRTLGAEKNQQEGPLPSCAESTKAIDPCCIRPSSDEHSDTTFYYTMLNLRSLLCHMLNAMLFYISNFTMLCSPDFDPVPSTVPVLRESIKRGPGASSDARSPAGCQWNWKQLHSPNPKALRTLFGPIDYII